eukprot:TRINITY_DN11547_c0_g1_i1.p1 TRINITY_DN11547_c0_g1~~TRINITY_DN11547_c0_g1_i1.p1  ORF type:complete len:293 (+),score=65.72 TRINITY_DN11547_c0_g1_i1:147-1025(+)
MDPDPDNTPSFATAEEAAQYWKDLALKYKQQYEEIEEFTSVNDELMKSLESQVKSLEDENGDLQDKIKTLTRQLAASKEDAQNQREARREEATKLQTELQDFMSRTQSLSAENAKLQKQIVELEQKNENEKRLFRTAESTAQRAETLRDDALERLALIQTEYDDLKESYQEMMQRMKEELRDAMEDAEVHRRLVEDTRKAVAATKTQVVVPATPPRAKTHPSSGSSPTGAGVVPPLATSAGAGANPESYDPDFVKSLLSSIDNALYLFETLEMKLGLKERNPKTPRPPIDDE